MRPRKSKKKGPPPVGSILMITLVLFMIAVVFSFVWINKQIKPTLMDVAERKTQEFATRGINAAVEFAEEYDFSDIAKVKLDPNGKSTIIDWNTTIVNKINRAATDEAEIFFAKMNHADTEPYGDTISEVSNGDPTVIEIPLGQATGNSFLANLGPKIPVNLQLAGSVTTNLVDVSERIGINNISITLYVRVVADVQVIVPFTTKVTTVTTDILVDKQLIMGDVPEFYGGDIPQISVPKKDLLKDE